MLVYADHHLTILVSKLETAGTVPFDTCLTGQLKRRPFPRLTEGTEASGNLP